MVVTDADPTQLVVGLDYVHEQYSSTTRVDSTRGLLNDICEPDHYCMMPKSEQRN